MYSACNGHLYRFTVCSSMHPQRVQNCELLLKLAIYQLRVPSSHRYRSLTSAFYQSPVLDSRKRFKHTNAAVRGDNHYRGRAFCLLWGFFTFHCDSKKKEKKIRGCELHFGGSPWPRHYHRIIRNNCFRCGPGSTFVAISARFHFVSTQATDIVSAA